MSEYEHKWEVATGLILYPWPPYKRFQLACICGAYKFVTAFKVKD